MSDHRWVLPNLFAYFDEQEQAIFEHSRQLAKTSPNERVAALETISDAVETAAANTPDHELALVAFVVADHLYKAANTCPAWNDDYRDYLVASARTLYAHVAVRGLFLNYIVDNSFPTLQRPLELFPYWYQSCGIVYACPQSLARQLMTMDKVPTEDQPASAWRYQAEALHVAHQLVAKCAAARRHFVYLDTDATDDSFGPALRLSTEPGVISVIRNDAPVAGSNCNVTLPTGPGPPASSG